MEGVVVIYLGRGFFLLETLVHTLTMKMIKRTQIINKIQILYSNKGWTHRNRNRIWTSMVSLRSGVFFRFVYGIQYILDTPKENTMVTKVTTCTWEFFISWCKSVEFSFSFDRSRIIHTTVNSTSTKKTSMNDVNLFWKLYELKLTVN